jgi:hypothetical protein
MNKTKFSKFSKHSRHDLVLTDCVTNLQRVRFHEFTDADQ